MVSLRAPGLLKVPFSCFQPTIVESQFSFVFERIAFARKAAWECLRQGRNAAASCARVGDLMCRDKTSGGPRAEAHRTCGVEGGQLQGVTHKLALHVHQRLAAHHDPDDLRAVTTSASLPEPLHPPGRCSYRCRNEHPRQRREQECTAPCGGGPLYPSSFLHLAKPSASASASSFRRRVAAREFTSGGASCRTSLSSSKWRHSKIH